MNLEKKDIKLLTDDEKMEIVRNDYNEIAEDYMKDFWNDTSDNKYVDKFLKNLSGKKILDAACGIGRECNYIKNKGFEAIGIDFSEEIIKECKKKSPSGNFEVKDLTNLDYPENSFDGILFMNVLFNIPKGKLDQTFKTFSKILKTNGKILMIFEEGDKELLVEEPLKKDNYVYMCHYTFEFIENILKKYNLKIYDYEREIVNDENCPMNNKLVLYVTK